jgi:hypothetical protein
MLGSPLRFSSSSSIVSRSFGLRTGQHQALISYLGIPVFLAFYFGYGIYTWSGPWAHPPQSVDLITGLDRILSEEQPPKLSGLMPWYMWPTKMDLSLVERRQFIPSKWVTTGGLAS